MIYAVNIPYSNTTLVKVKYIVQDFIFRDKIYSNTTLVKVKYGLYLLDCVST